MPLIPEEYIPPDVVRPGLREIVAEQIGLGDHEAAGITDATRFQEDLNADSLDVVELMMEAEDAWSIAISDDEGYACETFGQAVAMIEGKIDDN